jgi:hypothetical protein
VLAPYRVLLAEKEKKTGIGCSGNECDFLFETGMSAILVIWW